MFRLSLYPIADSFTLVIAAAVVLVLLMFVFRAGKDRLTRKKRIGLVALRLVVIALTILAMLRPTLIYMQTKKQPATLVVLCDDSRSMSVPDSVGNKTRFEALGQAIADAAPALAKLARDYEVKAYAFDAEARPLQVEKGKIVLPEKAEGKQTALGNSLEDVLRQEAAQKLLLGVVLLSDGAQRTFPPRDLAPQTAAARLKNAAAPLYTFTFGQSRGLGQARDVAVKDLLANPVVFVKNPIAVSGQIRVDGFVNREIPVRVLFETSPGKMETVAEQKIKAATDGQLLPIQLEYIPQTPGEFKLTLEAVPQPGELVTTNNRLSTFVNVRKGGLNALYLEGTYRVELKFIRRALDASQDIHVDYRRLDANDKPGDLREWFKPGKYDVYILGDIDASVFSSEELADLAQAVDRGAGLMMIGGQHNFAAGGYSDTPLAKLLPVEMDRLDRQRPDDPIRQDLHWPGPLRMQPTLPGQLHFALRLAQGREANAEAWSKLPPLDTAVKFRGVPQRAVVLLNAGDDKPLLISSNYGGGRVLAFAGESTWKWPLQGFDAAHKRFWRQIVLWLAKKDESQEGSVWVKLEQRRFAPGQRVEFSAGARDPAGEPLKDAEFKAEIVLPDGNRRPLSLVKQEDRYTGSFRETQMPGDYAVEVKVARQGQEHGSARGRFTVFQQDLELDNAAADAETMKSLAAMTGGQSLAPEELPDLIRRLAERTSQFDIQQETKKTFWDTWPFFLFLIGLLTVEWYLRKRWGLV
ncbi:MAG: hypothetical protein IT426_13000 [Pirellulales bacterium]|nr:hypothetical protein [Pirellulales bacterium]